MPVFALMVTMKSDKRTLLLAILFLSFGIYSKSMAQSHENAQTPQFLFPLGCTYGQDCWAVNYVDVDPAKDQTKDFQCNSKTYDGHQGTDFALGSVAQMNKGIDVLAAAAGKVLRLRDGESDALKSAEEIKAIQDNTKECGNGILIDHGNGLQTMYCHLRKDSVVVKPGQNVKAGEKIAQVGQSGFAEFPHLHLGVIWEGAVMDPYTGKKAADGCGEIKQPFWHQGLPIVYDPVAIFDGGFMPKVPDFSAIQRGEESSDTLSKNSAAFVFWVGLYNIEAGDQVSMSVTDPEGNIFHQQNQIAEKTRARQYYYAGRKIGNVQLKNGQYEGKVTLVRGKDTPNPILREKTFTVSVTDK